MIHHRYLLVKYIGLFIELLIYLLIGVLIYWSVDLFDIIIDSLIHGFTIIELVTYAFKGELMMAGYLSRNSCGNPFRIPGTGRPIQPAPNS